MFSPTHLETARAAALSRWGQPYAGFASGHDRRTSDQGLLTLLYGGLEHAANYHWLNAGRRLIDKTYIDMLWHVQGLTDLRSVRPEQIAAALDPFIIDVIRPAWRDLPYLADSERLEISISWVEQMAGRCFGSVYSEAAASRLLFFLAPMLPVFNQSRGHHMALDKVGHRPADQGYQAFAQAAGAAYRDLLPRLLDHPSPDPSIPDPRQGELLNRLLEQTDWWTRRVFDEYLGECVRSDSTDVAELFGSNDFKDAGDNV